MKKIGIIFVLFCALAAIAHASAMTWLEDLFYGTLANVSTTSTTMVVDTNETVGPLVNGRKYLIFYRAVFDGNDNAAVPEIALDLGTGSSEGTTIALASGEGTGSSSFLGNGQIQGFRVLTGDGTNSVRFKYRCVTSSDTCFFNGFHLIAIPLNDPVDSLVENKDWFFDGTTSATAEVSNVGNTWTTARTVNFTTPAPTQDWLACGAIEVDPDTATASESADGRFQVDSTTQITEWVAEPEDDRDMFNFAMCRKVNLTAGSHTLRWQIHNRGSTTVVDAYRAQLLLLRPGAFSNFVYTSDSTGRTFTNTLYNNDASDYLELTYDSIGRQHQTLQLATVRYGYSSSGIAQGMIYCSDCGPDPDQGGERMYAGRGLNNVGGTSDDDVVPTLIMRMQTVLPADAAINYGIRSKLSSASGTGSLCKNAAVNAGIECNFFMLGLDTPTFDPIIGNKGGIIPAGR